MIRHYNTVLWLYIVGKEDWNFKVYSSITICIFLGPDVTIRACPELNVLGKVSSFYTIGQRMVPAIILVDIIFWYLWRTIIKWIILSISLWSNPTRNTAFTVFHEDLTIYNGPQLHLYFRHVFVKFFRPEFLFMALNHILSDTCFKRSKLLSPKTISGCFRENLI